VTGAPWLAQYDCRWTDNGSDAETPRRWVAVETMDREFPDFDKDPRKVWFKYERDESIRRVGQQSQYMACDSMYVQPSFLTMHEAEVNHDADSYPRPKTT
jgi:hypothetical protein